MADKGRKTILVVSSASYRGMAIMDITSGLAIFLGMWLYTFRTLQETTAFIDAWYDLKKN